MTKRICLALLFPVLLSVQTRACLNYYYTLDNEGHFHRQEGGFWHFDKNFNQEKIVAGLHKLEKKLRKEHAYMALSDYAVGLMKLGRAKESREILAVLYNHYPNEYKLASNLGTAYELVGETDSALKYIKRGLELNPDGHEGSEWVHVKVLETKQELKRNPKHLDNHTVLGLNEQQIKDSKVREQIEIQIRERFPFSPGPDPIMAGLMVDLGDAYAHGWSIEYAKAFYDIAGEYYGNQSPALTQRVTNMKKLIQKFADRQPPKSNSPEGTHIKLGGVNYRHILDEHPAYEIDWSAINTDVDSLLAMVDMKHTAGDLKQAATKDTTDGLRYVEDETKPAETGTEKSGKSPYVIYYVLAGALLLALALYFLLLRKKSG